MKKNLKMATMLMAMTTLTACDYLEKKEFEKERSDKGYQSAMADYSAGKLDEAVAGLKKVVKSNPANSSARFQLACLQQDKLKDLCAAFSNYTEYLNQEPTSDKAQLAKDRLELCEKDLAKALAKKYGIISSAAIAEEYQRLEEDVKKLTAKNTQNQKELTELTQELANLRAENERLKKQFTSIGLDEADLAQRTIDKAALLDEADADISESRFVADEIAALKAEELDEREVSEEAKELKAEVLPEEDAVAPIKVAETPKTEAPAAPKKQSSKSMITSFSKEEVKVEKPDTYIVEEGDTLYKIAVKFYGRSAAWQMIREANKETVSTDGRVRAGQELKLP